MRIENFFAFKFIKKNYSNKDVSTSSLIVISVISVSIIFFIISLSIMNGYIYNFLRISLEVKTFHIDYPYLSFTKSPLETLNKIKEISGVKYAGLYRETKVLLSANNKNNAMIYFRTMPEEVFSKDDGFADCIKIIDGIKSINKNEIMISKKTSEKLMLKAGDYLFLIGSISDNKPKLDLKRLKVSGIFTTGYVELDEQIAFIGNKTGDDIFGKDLHYNIFIKLNNYKKANDIVRYFEVMGYGIAFTWEELNKADIIALNFEKNIIAFIVILVILMATFNILTTVYIVLHEKRESIGILKAIGYSPKNVTLIFLLNGIYLSCISIILGVTLGLMIMYYLNDILIVISNLINLIQQVIYKLASIFITIENPEKIEIFSKDFYLDKIYTDISFPEIFFISFVTLIFSILAALIPAFRAGKIKPNEVLKNE